MNIQNSSSIDLNSSEEKKEDINDVIILMNNQYLKVRRPDENNILDYLNYDQQQPNDKFSQNDQVINAESPQQALLSQKVQQSYFQQPLKEAKNNNAYIIKLLDIEKSVKTLMIEEFNQKYQHILNDLGCNFSPIEKERQQIQREQQIKKLSNFYTLLYFIFGILYYFEITIEIAFGEKYIFHIIFYIFFYLIMGIESLILLKVTTTKDLYGSVFHTILFLMIIINSIIDFQYFPILLLPFAYFLRLKYLKIQRLLIQYIRPIKMFEILVIYFLYIHLSSCFLYLVSESGNNHLISSMLDTETWEVKYLYSFYWSITTITTLGQNVINFDSEAAIIATILIILGNITLTLFIIFQRQETFLKEEKFSENISIISQYLNQHKISSQLQTEILDFLTNRWSEKYLSNTEQEKQILQQLPQFLGEDLNIEMYQTILEPIPFFGKISKECLREILLQLKEYKYQNGETLNQTGLYYCLSGEFDLILSNNTKLESRQFQNKYYGLQFLFYEKYHPCTAISNKKSTFIYLSRVSFLKILRKYPTDYQIYRMQVESKTLEDGIECPLCLGSTHYLDECPQIHLVIDKLQVISQHLTTQDMLRSRHARRKDRSTNAVFSQKLFEDAASMYQEIQMQDETIKQDDFFVNQPIKSGRKKSRSLNSDENSKQLQKSNSGHSLSAIQKPQGSGQSFSTFSMFKDAQVQRKISKQQDSDKISSNSQNNRQHQSSSNSFKDLPLMMNIEDKIVDDSLFVTQTRNRKILIGKSGTTSIKITPPNAPLQAIPSESDINTLNEENSVPQLRSMSSKKYSSPQKKISSKATVETNKQFELMEMQQMEFELPANLIYYFPQFNVSTVIDNYRNIYQQRC